MRRGFRLLVTLGLAVSTITAFGSGAVAAATAPDVTRAQFVYQLDAALGVAPVYPSTPTFTDVPTTSPYYGYIEAAYQKGFISGYSATVFGVNGLLTREQMAKIEVTALGYTSQALQQMSARSTFTDDSSISAFARGYVIEAVQLGLIHGYPNGSFQPGAYVTTTDEAAFIRQFVAEQSGSNVPATVSVSTAPSTAAVGQLINFAVTVKNASGAPLSTSGVTYSVSPAGAVVSGTSMIASQPGIYTVTATTTNGLTGKATVGVYGLPIALRLSTAAPVVADGQMQTTIQAAFVDQYGTVVANAQGSVALYYISHGGATQLLGTLGTAVTPISVASAKADGSVETPVNGVASFTVEGGMVPGAQDILEAVALDAQGNALSNPSEAQLTVTSAMEVPTKLQITSPGYLSINSAATTDVGIQVLDQAGEPMLYGSVPITVSISGPATFSNGATGQQSYLYNGSGTALHPASVQVGLQSEQGQAGTVTVTATASNVPMATATLAAVATGAPAKIAVTAPANTSFTEDQGSLGLTFGVTVQDAAGHPLTSSDPLRIEVLKNGAIANNIRIDGYSQGAQGAIDYSAAQDGQFKITDNQIGPNVGTYTVEVSDPNGILAAAPAMTFTETPGSAASLAVHASTYVSVTDPSTQVSATVEDAYGNIVPVNGMAITFANNPANGAPGITLSTATAYTQSGVATVTATAPVYEGKTYLVDASASGIPTASTSFTVEAAVAGSLQVSLLDVGRGGDSLGTYVGSTTAAQATDTVQITVSALDSNGQPVQSQDAIEISFSGTGLVPVTSTGGALLRVGTSNVWTDKLTSSGTDVITATAETAGSVGITAQDTSTAATTAGSAGFTVVPGIVVNYEILDGSGNNLSVNGATVQANVPIEVFVTPVDAYGNAATLTVPTTVQLTDMGRGGSFRLGFSSTSISSVQILAGESQQAVYYVNGTAGTYRLYAN